MLSGPGGTSVRMYRLRPPSSRNSSYADPADSVIRSAITRCVGVVGTAKLNTNSDCALTS